MNAKHTPGPWSIPLQPGAMGCIAHANGYVASVHIPRKVCEDRLDGENWLEMRERTAPERQAISAEMAANQILIAAAPDLLAALEEARQGLAWYQETHPESVDGSDDEAMARIDAAIAKATRSAA